MFNTFSIALKLYKTFVFIHGIEGVMELIVNLARKVDRSLVILIDKITENKVIDRAKVMTQVRC